MALGRKTGGRKAGTLNKQTAEAVALAELPESVRAALTRIVSRRAAASPAAVAQVETALQHLTLALRELLPDHPSCPQAQQLAALARRIVVGTTSTADLAILNALPLDALGTIGMKPGRFVVWLQNAQRQN